MPSPLRNTSPGLLRGFWQRLISILSQIFGSNIAPPISTTGNRPRKSDLSPSDNQFLQRLFDAAIIPISETLGASREDVRKALVQSRAGEPNELAQTSHLRVECAFKKVSPSRLAVTVSIICSNSFGGMKASPSSSVILSLSRPLFCLNVIK